MTGKVKPVTPSLRGTVTRPVSGSTVVAGEWTEEYTEKVIEIIREVHDLGLVVVDGRLCVAHKEVV